MRITLDHPTNSSLRAACGVDRAIGFFCEIRESGKIVEEYDLLSESVNTLKGLLGVLVRHGFFSRDVLEEALILLMDIEDPESIKDERVRSAADLVVRLKKAAGG
jgi:hypothetical protein